MPDAGEGQLRETGQIVTFYSFKGGTGRTMALANVAWILAANGMRVLIADWDLESPGLHRFFQPFMDPDVGHWPGVVDFVRRYVWAAMEERNRFPVTDTADDDSRQPEQDAMTALIGKQVSGLTDYAVPVTWQFPDAGAIHFLSPGKQDKGVYEATLSALDWDNLYNNLYGGQLLDALRAHLKRSFDYVLIDSRTGLSDIADICTLHLPDMVVDCFTLSTQGIEGAAMIARQIQDRTLNTGRNITILPVPMRIDHSQDANVVAGLELAERRFENLPAGISQAQRRDYWADVEVPYQPAYAYEEVLAPFGDKPGSPVSLLPAYERITARITENAITALPPREEWLRLRTRLKFARTPSSGAPAVVLDYSSQDQLWAEWVAAVLAGAGIFARLADEQSQGPDDGQRPAQVVAIVSESYIAGLESTPSSMEPERLICVTDTRVPSRLAEVPVIFLAGLSEAQAVDQLIERFDGMRPSDPESVIGAMRYPGTHDQIANIPARNVNFTGRDAVLLEIREGLRSRRTGVGLPLTVLGLGGVGKTQVALEYAHRFKADYDVVWWLNCDQPQYIDASLADLGTRLRERLGASVPEEGGVTEVATQVLRVMSEGAAKRWLLIYDNAQVAYQGIQVIEPIDRLLPSGGGHVLVTSRDDGWTNLGETLPLGVFEHTESITHLRRRIPGVAAAQASDLAERLGNMPLAVATAGALLASEGMSVSEYLRRLEEQPVGPLPDRHPLSEYPAAIAIVIAKAWHLSLDQLRSRSAAAYRLLEICSVMAPEISLDLLVSQAMVDMLRELDPSISERQMIRRLIRQIDLLALIKLDIAARQVQIHQVVQAIVNERMLAHERESTRQDVHQLLVAARPRGDVDDPQMWPVYRLIWPHVTPSGAMWSNKEQVRDLLVERVRYLRQRDDLERGQRRAAEIEQAWTAMLAEDPDPEMDKSLRQQRFRLQFNLANILRDLGRFGESRAVDESVLRGQQELLGEEHPHTLQTRSSLAADLRALGEYQAALASDLKTYESWSLNSGFGEEDAGTLSAAHNLALSYLLTGDFRSALRHDRQTLERRTSLFGPRHPRTLNSGAAVARDLLEAGRYKEAARMMEDVVARSHEALGDDARDTLNARLWLGVAQRCAGQAKQAAATIEAARSGLSRGFGMDSSDALASRLSQALNLIALGGAGVRDGRAAAADILRIYDARVGAAHPHSLICMLNIASAFYLEGDIATAHKHAEAAVSGMERRLGAAHPYTLAAMMVQASVLARLEKLAEAAGLEELVVAGRTAVLGAEHPDTLRCRANQLLTLQQQGEDVAAGEHQEVVRDLKERLGTEHPDVAAAAAGQRLLCMIDPQPF
jgi:tetratricopeptide (TPR) repeat protein